MAAAPAPPSHLKAKGRALWIALHEEYVLETPDEVATVEMACRQLDVAELARRKWKRSGMTYDDRFGQPKEHPSVSVERNAVITASRLLRELGLHASAPDTRPGSLPRGHRA